MLVVKDSIYRNVSEKEAQRLLKLGYSPVTEKKVKGGAKRGDKQSE